MLNTVFAKHHRIIFGVFSIIIIIAFTDFLTPGTGIIDAFRGNGRSQAVGEIFGKKVTYSELNDQVRMDMLIFQVFMNTPINQSMREALENQSFYNLASLEAARQAKITVSDEEVAKFLRNYFRNEAGKFNLEAYQNFVNNFLANEGFSEEDLQNAARQYLTLAKFRESQNDAVVVTPGEVRSFYNMLNEEFEVLKGEKILDNDALIAFLENIRDGKDSYKEERTQVKNRMHEFQSGNCTEYLCNMILKEITK